MFKVLVTGATGNVGTEVIRALFSRHLPFEVYAGVRQPAVRNAALDAIATAYHGNLYYTAFDFEQPALCEAALHHADFLFLLRPPALADVPKYFAPIIAAAVRGNIKHIVFLSSHGE